MHTSSGQVSAKNASVPWWRFGHVWMVIAGPALVVVASFITLYLAITRPDPVLATDAYRQGANLSKGAGANATSLAPAVQGRNHAATGVPSPAKP